MTDKYILDYEGNPVPCDDLFTWARWFDEAQRTNLRGVASTDIGSVRVSTVFLALDHNWDEGPPILYETMVFGGPLDQEQERYHTKTEALAGHEMMVARVKANQ